MSKPHLTHLRFCLGSKLLHSTSNTERLAGLPAVFPGFVLPLTSPFCCRCWSDSLAQQKSRKPDPLAFPSWCFLSHLWTWQRERRPNTGEHRYTAAHHNAADRWRRKYALSLSYVKGRVDVQQWTAWLFKNFQEKLFEFPAGDNQVKRNVKRKHKQQPQTK